MKRFPTTDRLTGFFAHARHCPKLLTDFRRGIGMTYPGADRVLLRVAIINPLEASL